MDTSSKNTISSPETGTFDLLKHADLELASLIQTHSTSKKPSDPPFSLIQKYPLLNSGKKLRAELTPNIHSQLDIGHFEPNTYFSHAHRPPPH